MAAWAGWEDDLLTALGDPHTAANIRFLDEWHSAVSFPCANNPVRASVQTQGWQQCLRGLNYAYATHADGIHATVTELNQAAYAAIRAALKSGNPFTVSDPGKVAAALLDWGSPEFSNQYSSQTASGGTGGHIRAPHALDGWKALQHSVNTNMRRALRDSERQRLRALQSLARARKVRL